MQERTQCRHQAWELVFCKWSQMLWTQWVGGTGSKEIRRSHFLVQGRKTQTPGALQGSTVLTLWLCLSQPDKNVQDQPPEVKESLAGRSVLLSSGLKSYSVVPRGSMGIGSWIGRFGGHLLVRSPQVLLRDPQPAERIYHKDPSKYFLGSTTTGTEFFQLCLILSFFDEDN